MLIDTARYFSSLPSKISSTSIALSRVMFVARLCGPKPKTKQIKNGRFIKLYNFIQHKNFYFLSHIMNNFYFKKQLIIFNLISLIYILPIDFLSPIAKQLLWFSVLLNKLIDLKLTNQNNFKTLYFNLSLQILFHLKFLTYFS